GGAPRFGPLSANGLLYVTVKDTTIVALDPATGQERWRHEFQGRIGGRGMNYWQSEDGKDKRLIVLNNGVLRQISADNGQPITTFGKNGGVDLREGLGGDISKLRPLQTDNPGR